MTTNIAPFVSHRVAPENVKAARVRAYILTAEALLESLRAESADWFSKAWPEGMGQPSDAVLDRLNDFARRVSREGMQASRALRKAAKEARR